jgi:hypothetical protein
VKLVRSTGQRTWSRVAPTMGPYGFGGLIWTCIKTALLIQRDKSGSGSGPFKPLISQHVVLCHEVL